MGIRYYDEAVLNKIKSWLPTATKLQILSPDDTETLFSIINDENKDTKISLPFMALNRGSDVELLNTSKRPMSFDGMMKDSTERTSISINAIPISIEYQLDIYCRKYAEADELLRNIIFNFINSPTITVVFPYNNANIELNANITLDSTIRNTSGIPQRINFGQFTRFTLNLIVDDAYLISIPVKQNVFIEEPSVEIKDNNKN